ncbi:MAG: hypothetical protein K6G30_01015 [Acetatifactor sp.]|nr:hypothetical protein [Acetatifactor sp.]
MPVQMVDGEVKALVKLPACGAVSLIPHEIAAEPMNRFRLFKDIPRMYDAWDIDSNGYCGAECFSVTVCSV